MVSSSAVSNIATIPTATKALQLIRAGLFPATMDQPDTAFTFMVLNDFHVHTLALKKSAYDHFTALKKLTDNTFSHKTPVRKIPSTLIYNPYTSVRILIVIANFFELHMSGGTCLAFDELARHTVLMQFSRIDLPNHLTCGALLAPRLTSTYRKSFLTVCLLKSGILFIVILPKLH
jgi:hypothetical protein